MSGQLTIFTVYMKNSLTFNTGLDFSARALRSSMAAALAVEIRPVWAGANAAAEPTSRERAAIFIVSFFLVLIKSEVEFVSYYMYVIDTRIAWRYTGYRVRFLKLKIARFCQGVNSIVSYFLFPFCRDGIVSVSKLYILFSSKVETVRLSGDRSRTGGCSTSTEC